VAKKKRITRKQLLKEPDEFLTFSAKAIQFAGNHRKGVLGLAIGVVVAALAVAGFQYFSALSERHAYGVFEPARLSCLAELSGGGTPAAREETVKQLEKVIEDYPSTTAARFSLLLYGDLSYQTGNYDKAIELYEKAQAAFPEERVIQTLIWNGLGYAYEAKKDYKAAAAYFRKIAEGSGPFLKADAYESLGEMMEALNDREKAVEAYDQVLKVTDDPSSFPVAEEKALRLKTTQEPSK
jgi:tetratricopeptide (TPR) repeat protein